MTKTKDNNSQSPPPKAQENADTSQDPSCLSDANVCERLSLQLGSTQILSAEDLAAYDALLDAPDLSAAQRQELLQMLWTIIVSVIDLAWESGADFSHAVHPTDRCGQTDKSGDELANDTPSMLKSKGSKIPQDYKNAVHAGPQLEER